MTLDENKGFEVGDLVKSRGQDTYKSHWGIVLRVNDVGPLYTILWIYHGTWEVSSYNLASWERDGINEQGT